MVKTILRRVGHFVALWKEGLWGKAIAALWALYGVFDAVRTEFFTAAQAEKMGIVKMIPHLSLAWWIVGALLVLLFWVYEASFRYWNRTAPTGVKFDIQIGGLSISDIGDIPGASRIIFHVSIEAVSGKSIAKNWTLVVDTGSKIVAPPLHITKDYTWTNDKTHRSQTVSFETYLPKATESTPVHGICRGEILFMVTNLSYEQARSDLTIFTLQVEDDSGKKHEVTKSMKEIRESGPASYDSRKGWTNT